jgi:hypothetical protein
MPLNLNIWSTLIQKKSGFGGGSIPIPIVTEGGTKLYALIASGNISSVTSIETAVGLSRTLKI